MLHARSTIGPHMKVHGLAWLGSSSQKLEEMTAFLRDGLELPVELEQEHARVFRMPDGSAFEIFKSIDEDHDFFEHPVAGLLVDDVREVRAHLESQGIVFVGDVHDGVSDSWATAWSHFRAPDGYLYVLVSRPDLTPAPKVFDELRICLRVSDIEAAVRTYREGLGLEVVDDWTHPGGERGVLFGVTHAAIELFDDAQWDLVDDAEIGTRLGRDHALRVEVRDPDAVRALAARLVEAGGVTTGPVVETPWDQTCQRVELPGGEQLSLSVLPEPERTERAAARRALT